MREENMASGQGIRELYSWPTHELQALSNRRAIASTQNFNQDTQCAPSIVISDRSPSCSRNLLHLRCTWLVCAVSTKPVGQAGFV